MMELYRSFLKDINDFVLIVGMVGILLVLFTPIPSEVLDFLLLVNFAAALLILLVTFYTDKPLEFSTFPSLLLMTTLFRLALNISATRLILDDADAGKFIGAVGEYVVGGNYVIGLVVFLILIVVQYVVVTNGAQRVAEVAARFTLDSLPGKQMSVDADLNMGIIDHEEAKKRRSQLEKESNFYGAMDGASKFVKGDAIAGIIIILIDIIGGLSIGIAQHGMSWSEALHRYTLLTVGDGIVTQIPSLIIAVAAGIIITRAATDSRLGVEIVRQFSMSPKAIVIVAGALLMFVFLPGMPVVPVLIIAAALIAISWFLYTRQRRDVAEEEPEEDVETESADGDRLYADMANAALELKVGPDLRDFLQMESLGLEKRLKILRKNFAKDLGFILPMLSVRKDPSLAPGHYEIWVHGEKLAGNSVHIDKTLAIRPNEGVQDIDGVSTREPTYGLPAKWIIEEQQSAAQKLGYTLVDPDLVLLTHLQETIKRQADKFITRNYVEELINKRSEELGSVVDELIPGQLAYSDVQRVLQCLLREQVSIRNLSAIFDVMVDVSRQIKEPEEIAERCRQALRSTICEALTDSNGVIRAITISSDFERKLARSVRGGDTDSTPLSPTELEALMSGVVRESENLLKKNFTPVLLCAASLRRYLRQILARAVPQISVLSVNEVDDKVEVLSAAVVGGRQGQIGAGNV